MSILISHRSEFLSDRRILRHQREDSVVEPLLIECLPECVQPILISAKVEIIDN